MDKSTWLNDCRTWCKQIKYLSGEFDWQERPNHSGWLEATSLLLDEDRVSIPHLFMKAEYQPAKFGDRVSYGLMLIQQKEQRRVFMLEVYPAHVRSHREKGVVMFGPHMHLGDERLKQLTRQVKSNLGEATLKAWVERFRRHARVRDDQDKRIVPPFSGGLFD